MSGLREQLCLPGRVGFMGIGNVDLGDDGFGVRLAERLDEVGVPGVLIADTAPERFIGRATSEGFDHLIFLDAVEFGGTAGSAIVLDAAGMAGRFPQISTHKVALGALARLVEAGGKTKAWLLGVQPESLKGGDQLTPTVQRTLELLAELLSSRKEAFT